MTAIGDCFRLTTGASWRPGALYDVSARNLVDAGMGDLKPFSASAIAQVMKCWLNAGQTSPPPPLLHVHAAALPPPPGGSENFP